MKKTVLGIAAAFGLAVIFGACSNKQSDSDTGVVIEQEEVVGEVVDMPEEGSAAADSVVATAQAVAVDTAQASN